MKRKREREREKERRRRRRGEGGRETRKLPSRNARFRVRQTTFRDSTALNPTIIRTLLGGGFVGGR